MLIAKNRLVENASKILEEDLGIKLPEDYARFLDKYNGGITHKTEVKIGEKWDDVCGFYGITEKEKTYSFESMKSMGVLERYLDKKYLPIADNMFGDDYCISLKEKSYGTIYLLYHDLPGRRLKVANSFTEFIKNTKSEPIGHVATIEEREKRAIEAGFGDELEDLRPIWEEDIEYFSNLVQEEVILD